MPVLYATPAVRIYNNATVFNNLRSGTKSTTAREKTEKMKRKEQENVHPSAENTAYSPSLKNGFLAANVCLKS